MLNSAFAFFTDPTVRNVVAGCIIITITSSIVGCFTFLRKRALVGDAVAHSVLPGVCIAFMLAQSKDPLFILIGSFVTGWISIYIMDLITNHTKIKEDTATGLVLSVFFGIGILLLTAIQHSGNAEQAGLDSFIFGKAASLVEKDLYIFAGTSLVILLVILLFFKEFSLIIFDPGFAKVSGIPVRLLNFILTSITVLAVITGIQAVGVVLMAAMLITPAAAARFWTHDIKKMLAIAAIIGGISGMAGTFISYLAPAMPTGPWIVIVVSLLAIISFLFAPATGYYFRKLQQKSNQEKVLEENILKEFYNLFEKNDSEAYFVTLSGLTERRKIQEKLLLKGLNQLQKKGFVMEQHQTWKLTEKGKNYGMKVTRLHRLWELYLSKYLNIASDHLHDDAESIEHIITPELEKQLEAELNFPMVDPHNRIIPKA